MGNICRSPTAHAIFEHLVAQDKRQGEFLIDSAATHDYNLGEKPDRRVLNVAKREGLKMDHLRSRLVTTGDFTTFDLILSMDHSNVKNLKQISPVQHYSKIKLLLDYYQGSDMEIPDPYYQGLSAFDEMYEVIDKACRALYQSFT